MKKSEEEVLSWLSEKRCRAVVEHLQRRRFTAVYCATRQEAVDYVLEQTREAVSVGFGGSYTIAGLGVEQKLAEQGNRILNHGHPDLTPEEKLRVRNAELTCDLFLASSNAVTMDGILVNIDGVGNRCAAMTCGPKKVVLVIGRNKIVDGTIQDAIDRVKNIASPPNAMRLDKKTPCAETGRCMDCQSPDRICCVTTILERKPRTSDFHVVMLNDDIGF